MGQNSNANKKAWSTKRKVLITVLSVLAAIILIAGILAFVFRHYIWAAYVGLSSSEEQIHSMQVANDKKHHDAINQLSDVEFRDLSKEEMEKLASGELSPSDALVLIMGGTVTEATTAQATEPAQTDEVTEPVETEEVTLALDPTQTEAPKPVQTEKPKPVQTEKPKPVATKAPEPIEDKPSENLQLQSRVDEIIAEIYLLRATYLIKIEEVISAAKKEYVALPKEQHNLQGKAKFISNVMIPRGNALEKECDAEMELLLGELKNVLVQMGSDTSIIQQIREIYQKQKDLKLAELTAQYYK